MNLAAREALGAAGLRAFHAVLALPKPMWLMQHLWRNRIGRVCFLFDTSAGVAEAQHELEQHVEDLIALQHARVLDAERVSRLLSRLSKPTVGELAQRVPLRAAEAAGPLPDAFPCEYTLFNGAAFVYGMACR